MYLAILRNRAPSEFRCDTARACFPQNGNVPKSPFPQLASLMPSAGNQSEIRHAAACAFETGSSTDFKLSFKPYLLALDHWRRSCARQYPKGEHRESTSHSRPVRHCDIRRSPGTRHRDEPGAQASTRRHLAAHILGPGYAEQSEAPLSVT